jgi:hypothetical protein
MWTRKRIHHRETEGDRVWVFIGILYRQMGREGKRGKAVNCVSLKFDV